MEGNSVPKSAPQPPGKTKAAIYSRRYREKKKRETITKLNHARALDEERQMAHDVRSSERVEGLPTQPNQPSSVISQGHKRPLRNDDSTYVSSSSNYRTASSNDIPTSSSDIPSSASTEANLQTYLPPQDRFSEESERRVRRRTDQRTDLPRPPPRSEDIPTPRHTNRNEPTDITLQQQQTARQAALAPPVPGRSGRAASEDDLTETELVYSRGRLYKPKNLAKAVDRLFDYISDMERLVLSRYEITEDHDQRSQLLAKASWVTELTRDLDSRFISCSEDGGNKKPMIYSYCLMKMENNIGPI